MEIRILRYFLAIAREENMTRAAERLHISQPSLSKEIKKLEEELGHELFIRTNKNMILNDEGMLLRKRAEDILAMVDKTAEEFSQLDNIIGGEIRIGCAETILSNTLQGASKHSRSSTRISYFTYSAEIPSPLPNVLTEVSLILP